MILVALAVVFAAATGIACEHRYAGASRLARRVLSTMLYALIPFVAYVNVAHLHVTTGTGVGIVFAWIVVGTVGAGAFALGRYWLRLDNPQLGAVMCSVVVVNTGYLGLPMAVALFGSGALGSAVAYDQLVSGPSFFVVAFAIGAALSEFEPSTGGFARAREFVVRNPPLIAALAGLLASPALAPAPLPAISHAIVWVMLVLGFFAVGVNLAAERRDEAQRSEQPAPLLSRPDRRVAVAVGLRMVCAPLLLAALSTLFVRVPSAYLLQATMPSGINSLIVGHAYGLDQRLVATVIVWSTAAALVVGLALSL